MSGFSDPKWWPQPPPSAPKHISLGAVLVRSVLPLVAIAGVVVFVVLSERHHNAAATRSQAAYARCLLTHDAVASATADVLSAQAIADCQALDPVASTARGPGAGFQAGAGGPAQRLMSCIRNAIGASGGGNGGFSRPGSSSAFRAAALVCESIIGSSEGHGTPIGASSTVATTPPKL